MSPRGLSSDKYFAGLNFPFYETRPQFFKPFSAYSSFLNLFSQPRVDAPHLPAQHLEGFL